MTDKSQVPEWVLRDLLDWIDQLESADSYQGFRLALWAENRPRSAITSLKAAFEHERIAP